MDDLMIDIEAFSTRYDAFLVSVGACFFDRKTGMIGGKYHEQVAMVSDPFNGALRVEEVAWWMGQEEEARKIITESKSKMSVQQLLKHFSSFVVANRGKAENLRVWGNGSSFDVGVLTVRYQQCNMETPWTFRSERDVRTIVDVSKEITSVNPRNRIKFEGIKHNPLDDAIHQAKYVCEAFKLLRR